MFWGFGTLGWLETARKNGPFFHRKTHVATWCLFANNSIEPYNMSLFCIRYSGRVLVWNLWFVGVMECLVAVMSTYLAFRLLHLLQTDSQNSDGSSLVSWRKPRKQICRPVCRKRIHPQLLHAEVYRWFRLERSPTVEQCTKPSSSRGSRGMRHPFAIKDGPSTPLVYVSRTKWQTLFT